MQNYNINIEQLNFQKDNGLVTAVIQDIASGTVLMVGYQDREAVQKTVEEGRVTFWSRTKQQLWTKGETSGNFLQIQDLKVDCDQDTILYLVEAPEKTCHLGNFSCFGDEKFENSFNLLSQLEDLLQQRKKEMPEGSYVASLFADGLKKMGQKVGEEGVEVSLEAESGSDTNLKNESADLLFHLLVLLSARDIALGDVIEILQKRYRS